MNRKLIKPFVKGYLLAFLVISFIHWSIFIGDWSAFNRLIYLLIGFGLGCIFMDDDNEGSEDE